MPDILASIFELENARGFFVPKFDIYYVEEDTGRQWYINCGGLRAYFIRIGEDLGDDFNAQSADRNYSCERDLSVTIKPKTASAKYRNGILELTVERKEPAKKEEGFEVKIE